MPKKSYLGTDVRIMNRESHLFGSIGYVFKLDECLPYAWVQFDHDRQFAQSLFPLQDLEIVDVEGR